MREDRRVVAVERVGERRDVSPCRDRGERHVDAATVRLLQRELRRPGVIADSEPGENLRCEQVVRCQPENVPGVVTGGQRSNEVENTVDRGSVYRDEAGADESLVLGVDDEHAVRELVEAKRIEVELVRVGRISGKDSGVPVAWPEQRDEPEHADEKLVPRQAGRALRERAHLGFEALARDATERIGVDLLDLLPEVADVVRCRRRCGRTSLRHRDDRDHGE